MMDFGMSEGGYNDSLPFQTSAIAILKMGDNRHRIIAGCVPINTVFYPCTVVDSEGDERDLIVPFIVEDDSIFEKLAELDKKIRQDILGIDKDKVSSPLQPSRRYAYSVFDKNSADAGIKVAHYPKTVHDRIYELQSKPHPDKETYLANCLMFMHDIIISKKEDSKRRKARGRGIFYSCDFAPDNPFQGKIPVEMVKINGSVLWEKFKENDILPKIFNTEELEILENKPVNLKEVTKAITDDELIEKMKTQLFINLKATDPQGNFLFPEQKLLAKEFIKLGLELDTSSVKELPPKTEEKATDIDNSPVEVGAKKEDFNWSDMSTKTEGDEIPF